MKIKGAIFDLDGTLLNTLKSITLSINHVLGELNLPLKNEEECKLLVGEGLENALRKAMPEERRNDFDISELVHVYREFHETIWNKTVQPYEGVKEMLNFLQGKGVKLAILSNKANHFVKIMADAFLPEFDFIDKCGALPGIPLKPDKTMPLLIADHMKIQPSEIIFVGDSWVDMKTATNVRMIPVGVLWGFRDKKELQENGAKYLLNRPTDIKSLF